MPCRREAEFHGVLSQAIDPHEWRDSAERAGLTIFPVGLSVVFRRPASRIAGPVSSLTRIVSWSHALLREILLPGDTAVDLTAGNGHDTSLLVDAVGPAGKVVAFDIQMAALDQTAQKLKGYGCGPVVWSKDEPVPDLPGCYLVHGCHTRLAKHVKPGVKAIVANLGYLPGGDPGLVTVGTTTVKALQQGLRLLCAGGRLAVTVYPGHPGGSQEGSVVRTMMEALPREAWHVLLIEVANQSTAPCLLVAEKR